MLRDRFSLKQRFLQLSKISDQSEREKKLAKWQLDHVRSSELLNKRMQVAVHIDYPELPVADKKEQIKALIDKHQVVIIAGETGSGKTTQLPKMCLELGRGRSGMIGHTQPRRLAARSVASRIAEELNSELGDLVGFKVRFTDKVSDNSLVKLLTDGMLLAEIQHDKFLNNYDTIIIDEAHERSLNIDFLLGYLKRILPKRPDLKVIITSATIDPERFSKHFNNAPCLEVSGRSYPVEIRHYDYIAEDKAQDQPEAIKLAVDELFSEARGDILVFLSGEREIRETQVYLNKQQYRNTDVIPLYARLSAADQQKIFHPKGARRIVLATNVAETSLTVPGIKYVIDTGLVRMSRYSHRLKVQRLPIEPISQASAKQRAGRCGRTSEGICIRLYDEQDFLSRSEFTDPEITRTHLSSVILQMLSLGLGNIYQFEFVEPPEDKFIKDGLRLLEELQATKVVSGRTQLTGLGRKMAKLPLDPKYACMLLAAKEYSCVFEVMVITAGLSVQDPRERPFENKQKADLAHAEFADKQSDLIALLNLYAAFGEQQKALSQNQLRKWCKANFINYQRMREWQDIVHQVKHTLVAIDLRIESKAAEYEAIHKAIVRGLLSNLGLKDSKGVYLGARNSQFKIFPGSGVFKAQPKWILAAELVETSNLYARQVAKIEAEWIEAAAAALMKFNYAEQHWSKNRGAVMAYMNGLLFGLPVVSRRLVNYSQVNPREARELFIRHALVQGDTKLNEAFLKHNLALIDDVELLEKKVRRRDILVDEEILVEFYQNLLPEHICSEASLKKWLNTPQAKQVNLKFDTALLYKRELEDSQTAQFPDVWQQNNLLLPLKYEFEPNKDNDGVSVHIPLAVLNQVQNVHFDWLVPGMRHALVVGLIKALPKRLRRNFVPAPDYATACLQDLHMHSKDGKALSITEALSAKLFRMSGVKVTSEDFELTTLDTHLRMNFVAVNKQGKELGNNHSLAALKKQLSGKLSESIEKAPSAEFERDNVERFDIDEIPLEYSQKQQSYEVKTYPALMLDGKKIKLSLFADQNEAKRHYQLGLISLIKNNIPSPVKYLQDKLPNKAKLSLYFNPFGQIKLLIDDIILAAINDLLRQQGGAYAIRTKPQYKTAEDLARMELNDKALAIALQVEAGLATANAIQKQVKGKIPLNLVNNIASIKKQLDDLVYKDFVFALCKKNTQIGLDEALGNWNRYLKALLQRTDKLKVDPSRDRLNQLEVDKAEQILTELREEFTLAHKDPEPLESLAEMIEEFKISIFAQQMGTKYPVSLKRIRNKAQELSINS